MPLALLFGLVAQLLFYGVGLGVNLGIAAVLLLAVSWALRPARATIDPLDRWIAPAAIVFSWLPALRSDLMLMLFDVPAALVLLVMAAVSFAGVPLTRRALDLLMLLGFVVAGRLVIGGAILLAALPDVGGPIARRAGGRLASVGIGLVLALPLIVVFAALFSSADAVFASAMRNAFDLSRWSLGEVIGRTIVAGVFAWAAGGIFLLAGRGSDVKFPSLLPYLRGLVSSTAATTMLTAVDALFLFFVALQIAYLFGGRDTLAATGLTYSAYARGGFFELIAVAVLAGGVVFAVELVVARRRRAFVIAALVLVAATLVVVASAAYRMQLYQAAYGWSEQRFYALAGIAWLGAGGIVAIPLIVRDATRWLLHAGGLLALGVAIAVNLLGPSAFVAGRNLDRVIDPSGLPADAYRGLDVAYLVSLGDGALPTIIEHLPRLPEPWRDAVTSYLYFNVLDHWHVGVLPWQAASLDRIRARDALGGAADAIRAYPRLR